ncbi:MAG: hypothetical protein KDA96_08795, partial [Planctomycetaceae bacterium]|nr:hypothetical protein [Planctomycetaceae bacterium]
FSRHRSLRNTAVRLKRSRQNSMGIPGVDGKLLVKGAGHELWISVLDRTVTREQLNDSDPVETIEEVVRRRLRTGSILKWEGADDNQTAPSGFIGGGPGFYVSHSRGQVLVIDPANNQIRWSLNISPGDRILTAGDCVVCALADKSFRMFDGVSGREIACDTWQERGAKTLHTTRHDLLIQRSSDESLRLQQLDMVDPISGMTLASVTLPNDEQTELFSVSDDLLVALNTFGVGIMVDLKSMTSIPFDINQEPGSENPAGLELDPSARPLLLFELQVVADPLNVYVIRQGRDPFEYQQFEGDPARDESDRPQQPRGMIVAINRNNGRVRWKRLETDAKVFEFHANPVGCGILATYGAKIDTSEKDAKADRIAEDVQSPPRPMKLEIVSKLDGTPTATVFSSTRRFVAEAYRLIPEENRQIALRSSELRFRLLPVSPEEQTEPSRNEE